jgi:hypothetical protein
MKKNVLSALRLLIMLFSCIFLISNWTYGQVNVVHGINYKQISGFETDYSINTMKLSDDGSRIVFSTGGPMVKVFTINADGTGLTQVYDFERTGFGPMVDISANGNKVIWCDGEGEIYIANADGTDLVILATLLPNPNPDFEDMEPIIPLPPRITADGSEVYFIHMGRDPKGSGVYKISADNTGLTMVFNYLDMAADVFKTDGSEYNYNSAFADGFDISESGNRMIVGTRIFKLAEGDLGRGDAIVVDGSDFTHLGDYATGYQPFSTNKDGDMFIMYKLEPNPDLGYDEIGVYFVPLGTADPVRVIGGLDVFGTAAGTEMTSSGNLAIVHTGNGRLPITLVNYLSASQLDLVSIDNISLASEGFRFSESWLPSISGDGEVFCFLSTSIPAQIWVARITTGTIVTEPSISGIQFAPEYVAKDGSTTATISAKISDMTYDIHAVSFEAFKDGVFQPRALTADWPYSGRLVDDGTFGDLTAGDGIFTNNTVRVDLPEFVSVGDYEVRIAAVNSTLKEVSMVDATPFSVVEPSTSILDRAVPEGFILYQNYPNPFRGTSVMKYDIPSESHVKIEVFNVVGKVVSKLLNEKQHAGRHAVVFDASRLPAGIYFYSMNVGEFQEIKKMQVLDY